MTTDAPDKQPFRVVCGDCKHEWVAAYTPMPMDAFSKLLKGIRCPMCGCDPKRVFLAKRMNSNVPDA